MITKFFLSTHFTAVLFFFSREFYHFRRVHVCIGKPRGEKNDERYFMFCVFVSYENQKEKNDH